MSDVLYPVSLVKGLRIPRMNRVLSDEFEDGTTATRRFWADKYFKRRFQVEHSQMAPSEFRYLRGFYHARNGGYDSFWFRDNIGRTGNAKVRFAPNPLLEERGAHTYGAISVDLLEVAPIRMLPEINEVVTAAGSMPLVWWDANRGKYYEHIGTQYNPDTLLWDEASGVYPGVIQGSSFPIGGILTQWTEFAPTDGNFWAKSASNVAELTGSQPACTLFCFAKAGTGGSANQILLGVGAAGAGQSMTLVLGSDDKFYAAIDGVITSAPVIHANSPASTWRSIAATWPNGSDAITPYVNAAAVAGASLARSYTAGPVALCAAADGSVKVQAASLASIAHAMVFNSALTLAQIKALHNLLGYQYGVATVP